MANRTLRSARVSVRGAPFCLIVCFCAFQTVGAVRSHPYGEGGHTTTPIFAASDTVRVEVPGASFFGGPSSASYAAASDAVFSADCAANCEHGQASYVDHRSTVGNLDDDWHFSVRILHFQRFSLDSAVNPTEVEDAEDLVELLEERHGARDIGVSYVPVLPQPAIDYAILIAAPDLVQDMTLVPVCFEVYGASGPPHLWADFCEPRLTLTEVIERLAQAGPPGASVYVGRNTAPLGADCSHQVTPGTLIRVLAPGRVPRPVRTLDEKLSFPSGFLRASETCPLPPEPRNQHHVGLAQPLAQLSTVPLDATGAPLATAADVIAQIARDWGPVRLMWPAKAVRDVLVRGEHVHNIVGLFPRDICSRIPVFVDGRHFGLPFQIYASKQGTMLLAEFLANIGLVLPAGHSITVTGTVSFDPAGRTVLICAADVVVLHPARTAGPEDAVHHPMSRSDGDDDEGDRERSRASVDHLPTSRAAPAVAAAAIAVRNNCESMLGATARESASNAPDCHQYLSGCVSGARPLHLKWNPCRLHDVLPSHRTGDTSGMPVGRAPARLPDDFFSTEMAMTQLYAASSVEQVSELPPPIFEVAAPHPLPEGGLEDPGDGSGDEPSPHAPSGSEFELMRSVPVMLIVMQGPPQKYTLWLSPDEPLSTFMDRAQILLNADRDHIDIFPAYPQPPVPYLVLVAAPRWFPQAGLLAFVCFVADEDVPPFMHTAAAGQVLEETLPCGPFQVGRRLDVYLPPAADAQPLLEPHNIVPVADLQPGALYFFQLPTLVPPQLLDPYQHLLALPHTPSADFPEGAEHNPHPCDVALLGVQFEQFVVRFRGDGSIKQQIGRHMGMPAHDVYWHRQPQGFETLVVSGRSVAACFGVRSIAVFGDPPSGNGIFVDPRAVGKPVAYRSVQQRRLQPSDVCRIMDVTVPDGYLPCVAGGVRCPFDPEFFLTEHGMNVVVWFETTSPQASVPEDAEHATSEDESGPTASDAAGSSDGDSFSAPRSRSPRRGQLPNSAGRGRSCPHVGDRQVLTGGPEAFATPATGVSGHTFATVPARSDCPPCVAEAKDGDQGTPAVCDIPCVATKRTVIPTPCRNRLALPSFVDDVDLHGPLLVDLTSKMTLLEEAGLTEATCHLEAVLRCVVPPPVELSLASTVPHTPNQALVVQLTDILATRGVCQSRPVEDWLDADLGQILQAPDTTDTLRARLQDLKTWWDPPYMKMQDLKAIHIYTDGSYGAVADQLTGPCSWAFGVWMLGADESRYYGHCAHAAVPHGTPFHLGESRDDALVGELLGLAWALVWVIDQGVKFQVPVTVLYDSTSAGGGTFGHVQQSQEAPPKMPSLPAFVTDLRLCASSQVHLIPGHVKSHSGIIGNEMVDVLAKQASRFPECCYERCLPRWPAKLASHPLRSWAWKLFDDSVDLPTLYSFPSEADRLQRADPVIAPPPRRGQRNTTACATLALELRCLTFNVLTLLDPLPGGNRDQTKAAGMRIAGKRDLLKAFLLKEEVVFAGLQETRLAESSELPDSEFWMFHAACTPTGQYGTALWVRKSARIGALAGAFCTLEHRYFTVVQAQPRLLVVDVSAPFLRLAIIVAHCPFDRSPTGTPAEFWAQVQEHVGKLPPSVPVLILADCNAHVGASITQAIGDVHPEDENLAGAAWHSFLLHNELAALNTHPQCHVGPSATWFSPAGKGRRLDYIAAPADWRFSTTTWVEMAVENLQMRDDHLPLLAHICLQKPHHTGAFFAPPERRALRPTRDWQSERKEALVQLLRHRPVLPWHLPVDVHYHHWVEQFHQAWEHVHVASSKSPRQQYLQQSTLEIVRVRGALRRYARQEAQELRRRRLLVAFAAFVLHVKDAAFQEEHLDKVQIWFWQLHVSIARATLLLMRSGESVRKAVRSDRKAYLAEVQTRVARQDIRNPRELFQALRKAFPATFSARRGGFKPLPQLLTEQGEVALTSEERMHRWRTFFADQEAGFPVSDAQYVSELRLQRRLIVRSNSVFEWDALPTLRETECILHQQRSQKACGNDGITSELLKLCVSDAARSLLPVLAKTTLGLQEPSAFRGGSLMTLAKKAATTCECKHYRSILLACVPGKVYHRYLRQLLVPVLEETRSPMQAGAVPRIGIEALSLTARLFQDLTVKRKQQWGLTLYDIRAAFYRVVRQMVIDVPESDEHICRLVRSLGLPDGALAELHAKLSTLAEIPKAGATPHVQALVTDLLQGTYFRMDTDHLTMMTKRGTRPGDPCADVLFAFLLSGFTKAVDLAIEQEGLCCQVPDLQTSPFVDAHQSEANIGFISWADDCLRPVQADTRSAVEAAAIATVQLTVEIGTTVGIDFTFDATKTCIMLPALPPTTRLKAAEEPPPKHLSFFNRLTASCVEVEIVDVYKHLGCLLASNATPSVEIKHRFAHASGILRPLAYRFFSARRYPLSNRRYILRSLSVSRFLFGSVALNLKLGVSRRLWYRSYLSLWRTLQRRDSQQATQVHPFCVLRDAQAPPPPLALAHARAALLQRLVTVGPALPLRLMQVEWELSPHDSWLQQIAMDVNLVAKYVPAAHFVQEAACPVRAVFETFVDQPHWWVRCVKQACKRYHDELNLWSQGKVCALPTVEEPKSHPCAYCGAQFTLRRYLATHMARHHGILSPSRHYAPDAHCVACLRFYHTAQRVQSHLRHSEACMTRALHVIRPLELEEIREAEKPELLRQKELTRGRWKFHLAAPPVQQCYGPRLPTFSERFADVGEDMLLADFSRFYRPSVELLRWYDQYKAEATVLGSSSVSQDFWTRRPTEVPTPVTPSSSLFA